MTTRRRAAATLCQGGGDEMVRSARFAAVLMAAGVATLLAPPVGWAGTPSSAHGGTPGPPTPALTPTTVTPPLLTPPASSPAAVMPRFDPQLEWPLATFKAGRLWAKTEGAAVPVAVVDTGIDSEQPDLGGAIVGTDDLLGGNGGDSSDDSHGTAVAGLIAARGSATDPERMAGLAPLAQLIDIRVAVQPSDATPQEIAAGIDAAVNAGAKIINVSLTSPATDPELQHAVSLALSAGRLVVAAAGDSAAPSYPADYPGVQSVAAVTEQLTPLPGHSSGQADISAPGASLYSTGEAGHEGSPLAGYVRGISGNGYAAAYVSAAAALLLSAVPAMSPQQAGQLLVRDARRGLTAGAPPILDPYAALRAGYLPSPAPSRSSLVPSRAPAKPVLAGSRVPELLFAAFGTVLLIMVGFLVLAAVRSRRPHEPLPGARPYESASWDISW